MKNDQDMQNFMYKLTDKLSLFCRSIFRGPWYNLINKKALKKI